MSNVGEKFLPLGTVVILKGASKRLMITGFCTMAADDEEGVMYDYSGCMYPEGMISSDQNALFNHDQIENIYHMGLVDQEEKDFKIKLNQLLSSNGPVVESAPAAPAAMEMPVPPVGPELSGYVGPVVETPAVFDAPLGNVEPAPEEGTEADGGAQPNFQFDENGVLISS